VNVKTEVLFYLIFWGIRITFYGCLSFFAGSKEMRLFDSKGIIATKKRTARIEKKSASFPTKGIIIPPIPHASPIIRLAIIDFPLGANSNAIANPNGRVAIEKNPTQKALKKTQLPGR
jgi:hypothetical protein